MSIRATLESEKAGKIVLLLDEVICNSVGLYAE